jgi:hypothetical protein
MTSVPRSMVGLVIGWMRALTIAQTVPDAAA